MNERIQKFAEEAARDTQRKHNNVYWWMQDEMPADATWREKFAELIVQECVTKMASEIMNNSWIDDAVKNTYKHFGVE
jgi:hypothetical protein